MKATELKKGICVWCSWKHSVLMYSGKAANGKYKFEDFGDKVFYLTESDIAKLNVYKK